LLSSLDWLLIGLAVAQILNLRSFNILEPLGLITLILAFKFYESVLDSKSKNEACESISKHPKADYVVMREGIWTIIPEDEILIGDLIYIKAGMKIPVDGLMVWGNFLKVSERYVHGEAHPLPKKIIENCVPMKSSPFLFSESHATSGSCWLLVLSIGNDRYSKWHPSPMEGWSFDASASLNSS